FSDVARESDADRGRSARLSCLRLRLRERCAAVAREPGGANGGDVVAGAGGRDIGGPGETKIFPRPRVKDDAPDARPSLLYGPGYLRAGSSGLHGDWARTGRPRRLHAARRRLLSEVPRV